MKKIIAVILIILGAVLSVFPLLLIFAWLGGTITINDNPDPSFIDMLPEFIALLFFILIICSGIIILVSECVVSRKGNTVYGRVTDIFYKDSVEINDSQIRIKKADIRFINPETNESFEKEIRVSFLVSKNNCVSAKYYKGRINNLKRITEIDKIPAEIRNSLGYIGESEDELSSSISQTTSTIEQILENKNSPEAKRKRAEEAKSAEKLGMRLSTGIIMAFAALLFVGALIFIIYYKKITNPVLLVILYFFVILGIFIFIWIIKRTLTKLINDTLTSKHGEICYGKNVGLNTTGLIMNGKNEYKIAAIVYVPSENKCVKTEKIVGFDPLKYPLDCYLSVKYYKGNINILEKIDSVPLSEKNIIDNYQ